jgi:hypothetical protein
LKTQKKFVKFRKWQKAKCVEVFMADRSEAARKAASKNTEGRNEGAKKATEQKNPQERSEATRKASQSQSSEERSRAGKKGGEARHNR